MRDSEIDKSDLLENALDAIVGVDENNIVSFWNKNAEAIFGWSKSEIIGRDMTDMIMPKEYRERHRMGMRRFISTGIAKIQNKRIEIPGLRKNGEEFPMELTVSSIKADGSYRFYSFMRDITEQKNAELKLTESQDELRSFANSVPLLAWMAHPNGDIFWYNDRWYEYTGTTAAEMEGWGWTAVHHPKVLPSVMERWTGSIAAGTSFEMVFPLKAKSGEYRSFLTRAYPQKSTSGQIIRWFGTNTDIEDSVRAEKQAQADKERLSFALSSANMGAWSLDLESGRATLSDELLKIIGSSKEQGTPAEIISEAVHPDDQARTTDVLNTAIAENKQYFDEYRIVRPDGTVRWVSSQGMATYGQDGTPETLTGVVMDVTEKKIKADELLKSETHLRAAIDSSAGGFYGVDKNGVTTVCNTMFLNMLGFEKQEDVIGKKLHDVIHHTKPDGSVYKKEDCPIYQAAQTGLSAHITEEYFYRLDGSKFPVEYWTLPLIHEGEVQGAVTTFLDISARKAQEEALRSAKEEAERANQLKSAFLANMSHEIRTPLGAMMGFADLLRDLNLSETERANYTDILARNGEQLSVIINDILDLSKVEAGHLNLEYTEALPMHIASEVVSLLRVKAKEKDLALELAFDDSTPEQIISDPTRIRQVLLNLVSNAIKFTKFGSVKIKVSGCKGANGHPSICFEIADTGIGIAPAQQDKIFEVFVQADGSMTRRFGGTGLGLALSKRLARAMNGDVTILKSKENMGSTFLFQVEDQPHLRNADSATSRAEKFAETELTADTLAGKKILVVDDAPDNQQLIWRYLTKHGATVEAAENGLLGYRKALGGTHDIVLMDIQMPEMDGYTATLKLRQAGYRRPIIALTAHAMDDVRKKCLNVGCSDHLTKPIDAKQLVRAILRYTSEQQGSPR